MLRLTWKVRHQVACASVWRVFRHGTRLSYQSSEAARGQWRETSPLSSGCTFGGDTLAARSGTAGDSRRDKPYASEVCFFVPCAESRRIARATRFQETVRCLRAPTGLPGSHCATCFSRRFVDLLDITHTRSNTLKGIVPRENGSPCKQSCCSPKRRAHSLRASGNDMLVFNATDRL